MTNAVGYWTSEVDQEFVGVEMLGKVNGIDFAVALKPPRPSSGFFLPIEEIPEEATREEEEELDGRVRKHASELRWNCIETFLRADVEHKRLDTKRLTDALMSCLGNEERERLALDLMAKVEVVPR